MAKLIGVRVLLLTVIAIVWSLNSQASPAGPLRLVHMGPPISDEKVQPPEIEVTRHVLSAMGVDASFEAFPQHRAWSMIVRGERDGIIGPMRSSKLEQTCSFPDQPLFPEKRVLWVRTTDAGKLKFSSFEDLVGHEVAITSLSSLEDSELSPELSKFFREHHNAVNANSLPETFQMLEAGRVDYALVGFGLGKRYIGALGLSGRIEPLLSHSFGEGGFGVCFTKGRVSPAFVDAFSHALRQFKQTEAYQALYRKYMP